jgi:hypothetical protein
MTHPKKPIGEKKGPIYGRGRKTQGFANLGFWIGLAI